MKQVYVKPASEVIDLEVNTLMMVESIGSDMGFGNTPSQPDVRGRRGKWGNLWYEEDVIHEEH